MPSGSSLIVSVAIIEAIEVSSVEGAEGVATAAASITEWGVEIR